jgi:hypothetical protein
MRIIQKSQQAAVVPPEVDSYTTSAPSIVRLGDIAEMVQGIRYFLFDSDERTHRSS